MFDHGNNAPLILVDRQKKNRAKIGNQALRVAKPRKGMCSRSKYKKKDALHGYRWPWFSYLLQTPTALS